MNNQVQTIRAKLEGLDTWTQLSVLLSWAFNINAAAINQAVRYIPDAPVDNGIEHFTEYDAARRQMREDAEDGNHVLPSLVGLHREIFGDIDVLGGTPTTFEDTHKFLTSKAPTKDRFVTDYNNRVRMGLKPGMPMAVFVEYEFERAMEQHNKLVARGEDAIRLCETCSEDTGMGSLPEWLIETMERKLIEKLHDRWTKLELRRTNPRSRKDARDAAASDQMMITRVLAEYGETPGWNDDSEQLVGQAKVTDDFGQAGKLDDIYKGEELAYRR